MAIREITRSTFKQLHEQFQSYDPKFVIFRGVKNANYELVACAGRMKIRQEFARRDIEQLILKTFKERSVPFVLSKPSNDWEWLALAQHHGLPTRLLDWTQNPLVATYFAVRTEHNGPSAIYVLNHETIIAEPEDWPNPLDIGGIPMRYIPNHVTPRIIAQSGLFTFHPSPERPYVEGNFDKLIIPERFKKKIKTELYQYGFHQASMFPGLDGLAEHIKWMNEESY